MERRAAKEMSFRERWRRGDLPPTYSATGSAEEHLRAGAKRYNTRSPGAQQLLHAPYRRASTTIMRRRGPEVKHLRPVRARTRGTSSVRRCRPSCRRPASRRPRRPSSWSPTSSAARSRCRPRLDAWSTKTRISARSSPERTMPVAIASALTTSLPLSACAVSSSIRLAVLVGVGVGEVRRGPGDVVVELAVVVGEHRSGGLLGHGLRLLGGVLPVVVAVGVAVGARLLPHPHGRRRSASSASTPAMISRRSGDGARRGLRGGRARLGFGLRLGLGLGLGLAAPAPAPARARLGSAGSPAAISASYSRRRSGSSSVSAAWL